MSIGVYAFLRIYFLSFGLSAFAQFRTHCPHSSAAAVPVAQRVQRLGVCALPCVVCLAACDVQAVWVRWSRQGCTGGVYSRRPAPPGQPFNHRKNKKDPPHFHKSEPIRLCKSPKIPKNTKRTISEPRLCYNQLKAIRQRKEESK